MTTKKKVIIGVASGLAVLILILAFVFLRGDEKPEITINADTSQKGPVQVTTEQAVARPIPSYIEGTGSFVADETTDVSPKVSGQVISTFVNVGDFVQRGQVIARLDDKDARLRLEQSKSALNQAEVAVKQAAARLGISANGRFDPANSPEVQSAYQNYLALVQETRIVSQRDKTELMVETEVRNALQAVRSQEARLNAATEARVAAEQLYESEQRKNLSGTSTVFLVLQRQTDLINARGREVQVQTDLNKAITQFQRAIGTTLDAAGISFENRAPEYKREKRTEITTVFGTPANK